MDKKERLKKQLDFIMEIDKVKNIFRQTYLADGKRKENDAEHSWHLALMAVLLKEYYTSLSFSHPVIKQRRARKGIKDKYFICFIDSRFLKPD